ncbi:MAG: hypothetical protein Q9212_007054 [Teloschistes hypoglaucus]
MARSLPSYTWERGFREPLPYAPWDTERRQSNEHGQEQNYHLPPSKEQLTSTVHNPLGLNVMRTWPTLYDGTNSPHGIPTWWNPSNEVDVLICGDKAEGPLLAGRADGVQPRFLEILHSWDLAEEVHEEGPLLDHTVIYKDGQKLYYNRSHQSDSRYRGLHIITQGQIERIYIRDLLRHKTLVERCTVVDSFETQHTGHGTHPVRASVRNEKTGKEETIRAKFLVGADGAGSSIRKQLEIPFDGVSTDIYWAITDCKFETDFPYITTFGVIVNSEHGGCIIVPREDGFTRMYTQIGVERAKEIAKSHGHIDSIKANGRINEHSLSAEEILEQTNRIFAPYTLKFASPISWFAVWRSGDAAHVHSVMGAFGLNASIMDASNLAWKIGLISQSRARLSALAPTYDAERRLFAQRIIKVSGTYLRFVCNSYLPVTDLEEVQGDGKSKYQEAPQLDGTPDGDLKFLGAFFGAQDKFLLGIDAPYPESSINAGEEAERATKVKNGVRAPNPRICFGVGATGYLYDKMRGASTFHILVFGSDLQGPVRRELVAFSAAIDRYDGFFTRFGGKDLFSLLLVTKVLPHEADELLQHEDLKGLREHATVLYDDRAPDEDAHYWYGVNHAKGAVVLVRPDLWVGISTSPADVQAIIGYLDGFLVPIHGEENKIDGVKLVNGVNGLGNGYDHHGKALDGIDHRAPASVKSTA